MDEHQMRQLAQQVLEAWNSQDVEPAVACYTDDVNYVDPNTRSAVEGSDALRRYLTKLFTLWKMHWAFKEGFLFDGRDGCAILWHATIRKADSDRAIEVDGMDLVTVRDGLIHRNEVYFDRTAFLQLFESDS